MGYKEMIEGIVLGVDNGAIRTLLADDDAKVRATAVNSLVEIARFVKGGVDANGNGGGDMGGDMAMYVLTIPLAMSHDDDSEDRRMVAAELLDRLSPLVGGELVRQFVIPEVISLAEDTSAKVRKGVARHMALVTGVGGEEETLLRLLPAFVTLSEDHNKR